MSEADLAELRDARRTEASLLHLEGMVGHHEGSIEAAGRAPRRHVRARPAARYQHRRDQAAEISTMQALLASL